MSGRQQVKRPFARLPDSLNLVNPALAKRPYLLAMRSILDRSLSRPGMTEGRPFLNRLTCVYNRVAPPTDGRFYAG